MMHTDTNTHPPQATASGPASGLDRQSREVLFLVVDDCPLILFQWQRLLPGRVLTIETPEELDELCRNRADLLASLHIAIVDYFFSKDCSFSNIEESLRASGFEGRILVASDAPSGAIPSTFARIPKDPREALTHIRELPAW